MAIIETFCSSLFGALYGDAALSAVTTHWLCLPAGPRRDHERKLCILKFPRENVHGHHHFTYQPSAYLWHRCGYILFTALVSEVWAPLSPAAPSVHPPIAMAICAGAVLPGKRRGWWNPLQIVNLAVWNGTDSICDTNRSSFQCGYSITADGRTLLQWQRANACDHFNKLLPWCCSCSCFQHRFTLHYETSTLFNLVSVKPLSFLSTKIQIEETNSKNLAEALIIWELRHRK